MIRHVRNKQFFQGSKNVVGIIVLNWSYFYCLGKNKKKALRTRPLAFGKWALENIVFNLSSWYLTRMIFPEIYVDSGRKFFSLAKIYTTLIFCVCLKSITIVTRNNIVWKVEHEYCLSYCKTFFASARLQRVHKSFCYRKVQ